MARPQVADRGDGLHIWRVAANILNMHRGLPKMGGPATKRSRVRTPLIHASEPFLRSRQLCSYSRNSQHIMEPVDLLPRSQEPSTGHYTEPDRFSPYHPLQYLYYFFY
jgi:hypothetical protein